MQDYMEKTNQLGRAYGKGRGEITRIVAGKVTGQVERYAARLLLQHTLNLPQREQRGDALFQKVTHRMWCEATGSLQPSYSRILNRGVVEDEELGMVQQYDVQFVCAHCLTVFQFRGGAVPNKRGDNFRLQEVGDKQILRLETVDSSLYNWLAKQLKQRGLWRADMVLDQGDAESDQ